MISVLLFQICDYIVYTLGFRQEFCFILMLFLLFLGYWVCLDWIYVLFSFNFVLCKCYFFYCSWGNRARGWTNINFLFLGLLGQFVNIFGGGGSNVNILGYIWNFWNTYISPHLTNCMLLVKILDNFTN